MEKLPCLRWGLDLSLSSETLLNDTGYQLAWNMPQEMPRACVPSHGRASSSRLSVSLAEVTPRSYCLGSAKLPK